MKLLIVSQHYYPDSFRINEISEELVKKGNDVTVLTSLPDYATGRVPKNCKGLKNRKVNINGVNVIRCFSISRRSGLIFRVLNYLSFLISSTVKAYFLKEKFDLVMCYQTSPVLMANGARTVANKQKIPFFIYCLDLWPEAIKAWNVKESSLLYRIMKKYSRRMYSRADVLGISSRPFEKYLKEILLVNTDNVVYLPQHSEDMNLPDKVTEDTLTFAFGGNIGSAQNIPCILNAIKILKDKYNFVFDVYGDGSELENCKALSKTLGIEKHVNFYGRVDKQTLWNAYNNADAFLLTLIGGNNICLTAPAKLQEYMSGKRPIFGAISGAAAEIIKDANCGITVPADDYVSLAQVMEKFILSPKEYRDMAENGRKYFEQHFTLEKFISSLENIFDTILRTR